MRLRARSDLLVVLTDVAHGAPCSLQEAVAVVHLDTEGVQRRHDLGHVGDDSALGIGGGAWRGSDASISS